MARVKTRLLPADAPGAVEEAATALANGELVAFPTDTVYGLAARGGGVPVTSANRSGKPESTTAQQVQDQLDGRVAIILDGGPTPVGQHSTIVDCTTEPLTVLREGTITKAQLEEALLGVASYS